VQIPKLRFGGPGCQGLRAFLNLNFQKMFVGILGFFSPSFGVGVIKVWKNTVSQTNTCDTSTCGYISGGGYMFWGVG